MPQISWSDLPALPGGSTNPIQQIADKTRQGVCGLYKRYPSWLTNGVLIDTPALALMRAFMGGLCGSDAPPPPTQVFTGGQCPCVQYSFTYSFTDRFGGVVSGNAASSQGKINRFFTKTRALSSSEVSEFWMSEQICQGGVPVGNRDVLINQTIKPGGGWSIQTMRRMNNAPDTCGNPPPQWKPDLTDTPPSSVTNTNITINNSDGTNITIPVVYAPITPTLDVNVDVGGVTFKLDLGGITFSPSINFSTGSTTNNTGGTGDTNIVNNVNNNTNNQISNVTNQINQVIETVTNIQNNITPPPPPPPDTDKEEREEGESDKEIDENIVYVCIQLTQRPNKGTIQSGGESRDWMAAGWFEWILDENGALPREPIHFDHSCFAIPYPYKIKGFEFTLTNGARGRATTYKKRLQSN